MKLICPLLSLQEKPEWVRTCKKEECAWWIADKQGCAIAVIGEEVRKIGKAKRGDK